MNKVLILNSPHTDRYNVFHSKYIILAFIMLKIKTRIRIDLITKMTKA